MLIKDVTPAPASALVLTTAGKIYAAANDDKNLTANGTVKRQWIWDNLADHNGVAAKARYGSPQALHDPPIPSPATSEAAQKSFTLSPSSPLWPHRGNEALLKRSVWTQLCYPAGITDNSIESRGGVKVPHSFC